ncbi:MAG: hypothetical protein M3Y83_04720 [Actinomycetota bacterium]|nr:hypothetical protein [Actinomycetota bacterium]
MSLVDKIAAVVAAIGAELKTKADAVHTHTAAQISDSSAVGRSVLTAGNQAAARTAIGAGVGNSNLSLGTTSSTACPGNDARLSDARTPTAHTHSAADIDTGTLSTARLPSEVVIGYTGTGAGTEASVKIWCGTAAQYASATKYSDRLYFVT